MDLSGARKAHAWTDGRPQQDIRLTAVMMVTSAMAGFTTQNCNVPLLHSRKKRMVYGNSGRKHVHVYHEGVKDRPV